MKKFILNESKYQIQIPHKSIFEYRGEDQYEETFEDEFVYNIISPLIEKYIDYEIEYNTFENGKIFGLELRVDSSKLNDNQLIKLIKDTGIIKGLILRKREYGQWKKIYNHFTVK